MRTLKQYWHLLLLLFLFCASSTSPLVKQTDMGFWSGMFMVAIVTIIPPGVLALLLWRDDLIEDLEKSHQEKNEE